MDPVRIPLDTFNPPPCPADLTQRTGRGIIFLHPGMPPGMPLIKGFHRKRRSGMLSARWTALSFYPYRNPTLSGAGPDTYAPVPGASFLQGFQIFGQACPATHCAQVPFGAPFVISRSSKTVVLAVLPICGIGEKKKGLKDEERYHTCFQERNVR